MAERLKRAASAVAVAGHGGTAGVGGEEKRSVAGDPAGGGLTGRGPVDQRQGPVRVDGKGRDRVGTGFGDGEMTARVKADGERNGAGIGVDDRRGGQAASAGDPEDVNVITVVLGGDDQLRSI